MKLNPAGTALVYMTYLGGSLPDIGDAIAVDADGNVYVTGMSQSTNFPTKSALQPAPGGSSCSTPPCSDAFVSKLNPGAIMQEINASIDFDRRLYRQDIRGEQGPRGNAGRSRASSRADDAAKIARGLDTILSEMEAGKFRFRRALEDIHMNVESRLADLIGPSAGRLHTARSRNDQIATDFKLWVRDAIDDIDAALAAYQRRWRSRRWRMPIR